MPLENPTDSPYWPDFLTAMGQSFGAFVCPPVSQEHASAHECCEAIWRMLGYEVTPTRLASLTERDITRLAESFGAYFETDPPTVAQIREALAVTLSRWPAGSLGE